MIIMTVTAVLAVRLQKKLENRINLDVDLQGKVCLLREQVSKTVKCPVEDLDLVYLGVPLEDQKTLASYFFKSGRTIHVLSKCKPKEETPLQDVQEIISADDIIKFLKALDEYGHKNVLQKLDLRLLLKILFVNVPELLHDMGAIAILQDPELLVMFAQPDALRKILEAHRVLVEVLPHITTYLRENPIMPSSNKASTSSGNSYSLESLSDDEDMENGPSGARDGLASSSMAITAAQLSAALASARNFSTTGAVVNDMPALPTAAASSRPIITNEMFDNALQQAFASATAPGIASRPTAATIAAVPNPALPVAGGPMTEESLESLRTRLQPQLQQMREMGLLDETQNIRALQTSAGDVQAAIEMVFGSDIDMNF